MKINLPFPLILVLISFCSCQIPKHNIHKLPIKNLPLTVSCENDTNVQLVTPSQAWKYVLVPATFYNDSIDKNLDMFNMFPSDSVEIRHAWDHLAWNKKDTLEIINPMFCVNLFVLSEIKLPNNQVGILWAVKQSKKNYNGSFGSENAIWLILYNENMQGYALKKVASYKHGGVFCQGCEFKKTSQLYIKNDSLCIQSKMQNKIAKGDALENMFKKNIEYEENTSDTIIKIGL